MHGTVEPIAGSTRLQGGLVGGLLDPLLEESGEDLLADRPIARGWIVPVDSDLEGYGEVEQVRPSLCESGLDFAVNGFRHRLPLNT